MKCIILSCEECKKEFSKPINEYSRRIRNGINRFFCSLSCWGKFTNRVSPRRNINNKSRLGVKPWNFGRYNPFNWFVRRAKNRENVKGPTDLTPEYLAEIWNEQKGICPLTGIQLDLPAGSRGWKDPRSIFRASLDRLDNSKGYLQGNVRFVSVMANYARNIFEDEDVINFALAVAANYCRKIKPT